MKDPQKVLQKQKRRNGRPSARRNRKRHRVLRIQKNKNIVREAKNRPCGDCGKTYPWYVMDLDHCRGKKLFNLSDSCSRYVGEKVLYAEIAKCDTVCANCHRIRTFERLMSNVINFPDRQPPAASSSGRTPDFGSGNGGSTPPAASTTEFKTEMVFEHDGKGYGQRGEDGKLHFPIDTPQEVLTDAMLKKIAFSMDIALKPHGEEQAKIDNARIAKKLEAKNRW